MFGVYNFHKDFTQEGKSMQINSIQTNINFGDKYPTDQLISCICKKTFIRKSDSVNIITSILKLTKNEKKEMMHHETIFEKLLQKTGEYIAEQIPDLKLFAMSLDSSIESRHAYILNKAEERFGKEIEIERLKRSAENKNGKLWNA